MRSPGVIRVLNGLLARLRARAEKASAPVSARFVRSSAGASAEFAVLCRRGLAEFDADRRGFGTLEIAGRSDHFGDAVDSGFDPFLEFRQCCRRAL